MATIVDIDHEVGDLTEYDSTVTDSGDMSVEVGAALVGSYGLQFVVDDTNEMYGRADVSPPGSGELRYRFYIDPNSMTVDSGEQMFVNRCHCSSDPYQLAGVRLEYDGSNYELTFRFYEDDGSYNGASFDISDAPHYAEVYVVRSSSDVASDGTGQSWIDGVAKDNQTGLDNYDVWSSLDYLSLHCKDPGVNSGTYFMDDLVANDDGSEIGPAGAAGLSIPVAMRSYRNLRET